MVVVLQLNEFRRVVLVDITASTHTQANLKGQMHWHHILDQGQLPEVPQDQEPACRCNRGRLELQPEEGMLAILQASVSPEPGWYPCLRIQSTSDEFHSTLGLGITSKMQDGPPDLWCHLV